MHQVQIAAGSLVLLGLILSHLVSPAWAEMLTTAAAISSTRIWYGRSAEVRLNSCT